MEKKMPSKEVSPDEKETKNTEKVTKSKVCQITRKDSSILGAILKVCTYSGMSGEEQLNLVKTGLECNKVAKDHESMRTSIIEGNKPEKYDEILKKLKDMEQTPEKDRDDKWKEDYDRLSEEFQPLYMAFENAVKDPINALDKETVKVEIYPITEKSLVAFFENNKLNNGEAAQVLYQNILK